MEGLLIVTVGLPRSGKSTWAEIDRETMGSATVCPDAIRLAIHGQAFVREAEPLVWATALVMVRALFHAGHPRVVLDSTNTTRERRRTWYDDPGGLWRTRFLVFIDSGDECARRAAAGGRPDLLPVIDRMAAAWEPLGDDELAY